MRTISLALYLVSDSVGILTILSLQSLNREIHFNYLSPGVSFQTVVLHVWSFIYLVKLAEVLVFSKLL